MGFIRHQWLAAAGLALAQTATATNDLIVSEYIEGSSNNKAIELFNGTDAALDLAPYELQLFFNGSVSAGLTLNLSGTVAAGGVYVVAHSSADAAILAQADFTTGSGLFNGDDAVVLLSGGVVIDSIGQVGVDPGSEWGSGDTSTQNNTLRRKASVIEGDTNPDDAFDPAVEWDGFASDTFDDLGQYGSGDPQDPPPALGQCGDSATLISVIQGEIDSSPLLDQQVIVEAVVTGIRDGGFFMQEDASQNDGNPLTSEGLFIYGNVDAAIGQRMRIQGTVTEYYGLTELTYVGQWVACEGDSTLETVMLNFPFENDLERYEGMLVSVTDAMVVDINDLWRYGEIGVSDTLKPQPTDKFAPGTDEYNALVAANEQNILLVEDISNDSYPSALSFYPNFSYALPIRISDRVNAQGPLNYGFGSYRISVQEPITVHSERPATPDLQSGNLTIASFNVLNYFNGTSDGNGGVRFDYEENRGASSLQEFQLQEARIVTALAALNADVIGLMEIENDGFDTSSAIQSLVAALNAQLPEQDQYGFIATIDNTIVGTDDITVGLLYRKNAVKPKGKAQIIDMPVQTLSDGSLVQMRASLLQTFKHRASRQHFAVVVNHFKSKGSSCEEDSTLTDGITSAQGSCNALRVSAAKALGESLAQRPLPNKVMILGDLNAYSAEDPIAVLTDYDPEARGYTIKTAINTAADGGQSVEVTDTFGYHNVAQAYDAEGFSYWYYQTGQVGSLDHILLNDDFMEDVIDATHWHINSVEAYQLQYDQALTYYPDESGYAFTDIGPYRSSDHDPLLVSFQLQQRPRHQPVWADLVEWWHGLGAQ